MWRELAALGFQPKTLHQPFELGLQFNERLDRLFGYHHSLTIVARALLGVGVSVVVAVLSYELMEKKFLALKRYFAGEPSPAPAASSALPEVLLTTSPAPPRSGAAGR